MSVIPMRNSKNMMSAMGQLFAQLSDMKRFRSSRSNMLLIGIMNGIMKQAKGYRQLAIGQKQI